MFNVSKKKLLIIIGILIFLIILLILYSFKFKSNRKFLGTWTTDGITVYQFNRDYTGSLIVPIGKYPFKYKIYGDKIYIDFENETSIDSEYTYEISKERMVLKNNSMSFIFTKTDSQY